MTFKAGDKVYSYRFGIVELSAYNSPEYPLKVTDKNWIAAFTPEGKYILTDKHPSIITLEEAEKRGFVRRAGKVRRRVKYHDIYGKVDITGAHYASKSEFCRLNEEGFISFVDERLNECAPPQETVEWEEI